MLDFNLNFQVHYISIHLQPFFRKKYGFEKVISQFQKKFCEQEVSLPIYQVLSREDQEVVIENIVNFVSNKT